MGQCKYCGEDSGYCNMWQMLGEMVCDTPVPYYPTAVSCGLPNELGDVPAEEIFLPGMLIGGLKVFAVGAEGDSMEGVGIFDGDVLLIEKITRYNVYDIVLAIVDGQQLLKTYQSQTSAQRERTAKNGCRLFF